MWASLVVQGGPWALISWVVLSILRGRLVPRSQLLREIGYLERANAALEATVAEQKKQINILLGARGPVS